MRTAPTAASPISADVPQAVSPASSARSSRISRGGAAEVVATLGSRRSAKQERRRQIMSAAKACSPRPAITARRSTRSSSAPRSRAARSTSTSRARRRCSTRSSTGDADLRAPHPSHRGRDADARRRRRSSSASRSSRRSSTSSRDRALATLLLSAGHTPDAEAAERLDQFFAEVRDLLEPAIEIRDGDRPAAQGRSRSSRPPRCSACFAASSSS